MLSQLQRLVNSAPVPLSQDAPTGAWLKDEPAAELIREEIDKLSSPSLAGSVQWPRVAELGIELLCSKSKDLRVIVYTTAALFRLHRYQGAEAGLAVITAFLTLFWDQLHPPKRRMRARLGALGWLHDWLQKAFQASPPQAEDAEYGHNCVAQLESQSQLLREYCGPNAPSGGSLARLLQDMLRALPGTSVESATTKDQAPPAAVNSIDPSPTDPISAREVSANIASTPTEDRSVRKGAKSTDYAPADTDPSTTGNVLIDIDSSSADRSPDGTVQKDTGGRNTGQRSTNDVSLRAGNASDASILKEPVLPNALVDAEQPSRRDCDPSKTGARDALSETPCIELDAGIRSELKKLVTSAAPVVSALRQRVPTSPVPYQLARVGVWASFDQLPFSRESRTAIPGPAANEKTHLEGLFAAGSYSELIQVADTRFITMPLWLDLQWWIERAMQRAGAHFDLARHSVIEALRALLLRLPGLDALEFRDGTPFASPVTREWIAGKALAKKTLPAAPAATVSGQALTLPFAVPTQPMSDIPPHKAPTASEISAPCGSYTRSCRPLRCDDTAQFVADADDNSWAQALATARRKVATGAFLDGFRDLGDEVNRIPSAADRFSARVDLAGLCVEAGIARFALPMLGELDALALHHDLVRWQPELMSDFLAAYIHCLEAALRVEERTEWARRLGSLKKRLLALDIFSGIAIEAQSSEVCQASSERTSLKEKEYE